MIEQKSTVGVSKKSSLSSATKWSYSLIWGKQAITVGLSFLLAAMLGPRAFGVIAMALVFTSFIEMLQQQGLMPAIISRRELTDLHKDTAFWLVIAAGAAFTAVGLVVAPLWASINHLPELTPIIQVLALSIPLSSSVVVHEAILRRELAFKQLAIRSWLSVLAGGIAGVIGAVLGWGVWALVAQQLVTVITEVIVLWGVSSWRPRLRWNRQAARQLWDYSIRSASSSFGLFLGGRIDIVLGGAFFGPAVVGVYRMGQRLTQMALDLTARGLQSVSLPGLSEVQDDHSSFTKRLLSMQRQAACLALPLLGIMAGLGPCVERVLGPEWRGTATALMLLAAVQAIRSVSFLLGPALQASGRPGTLSLLMWLYTVLNVCGLVVASSLPGGADDLVALCVVMILATGLGSMVMIVVTSRCLGISLRALSSTWMPGLVAGVLAGGISYFIYMILESLPWPLAGGIAGLIGFVAAALVVLALDTTIRSQVSARFPGARKVA